MDSDKTCFLDLPSVKPPQGLFSRIIRRLGLEKQLRAIKRHLGLFLGALAVFIVLSALAFIGLKQVLIESAFGPYVRLLFSDPRAVAAHWHSFTFSIFESMPAFSIAALLASLALFLFFIKLAAAALEKILFLTKSICKNRNRN